MWVKKFAGTKGGNVEWYGNTFYFVHVSSIKVNGNTLYEVRLGHSDYPEQSKVIRGGLSHTQAIDFSINRNEKLRREGKL